MKIHTKYHGEIELKEEEILLFEKGIPGFPSQTKFVQIPLTENGLFQVLQSVTDAEIGFIITDPFFYKKDYDFVLEEGIVESLEIQKTEEIKVSVIITPNERFKESTANLLAPVIINTNNNKARQVILTNTTYQTKHPLFAEESVSVKE